MTEIGAFERTSAAVWERPERAILAYRAVVAALVAGVAETLGRAAIALDASDVRVSGIVVGLLVRAAIYAAVFTLAARMLTGSRWARLILVIGLGTVGLASLVVEPIGAILSAHSFGDLLTGWTPNTVLLGLFRAAHVLAVLVFLPAALTTGRPSHR
ncbi:hypothetical protein D7D52_01700 [Nocardia yunnanensis]|uniref:Uncharacterized protein n=1 Tax=Nocardia yunnanensis TaxID=2382165 RepID=A0A386Z826_9NOCA|nr:hypothetical protein [Nocardia yunnanensis]AYF72795.1 hypothetical protein D7D52_01700 [Nocardia yunnanensis]